MQASDAHNRPVMIGKYLAGKKILISGAAGYLATNLANMIRDVECVIVRLARPGTVLNRLHGLVRTEDIFSDVRDQSVWENALKNVDLVFHFAAQTSAYLSNRNPKADLDNNVLPMLHLLETCKRENRHPTVLFASTVTITGIPRQLPVDETHSDDPITIYDLHKLIAEQYLKQYSAEGVVQGASLRLANVYGPGPRSSRLDRGILNQMIRKALAGTPLTVYEPSDRLRDYVYISDVVHAFLAAAEHIEAINGQHFVIGSGKGHTLGQAINLVAERVALKTGKKVDITRVVPPSPQLPIEARNFVANPFRFGQLTGWKPNVHLIEGIDRTVEALLSES